MRWSLFRKGQKGVYPQDIQTYLDLDFKQFSRDFITDVPFVILDCETTGIRKSDQIITIGAVRYRYQKVHLNDVLDIRLALVESSEEAAIHGELANEELTSSIEHITHFLAYIGNALIVGHHISFDIRMINLWIQRSFPDFKLMNPVIDTLGLINRLDPQRVERRVAGHDSLQLDALCREYGIVVENRHTALGDAYLTAQLFHHLLGKLEQRGITKVSQLVN